MITEIITITTSFIFNISVNCYLVKTDDGYILIDTGRVSKRKTIEQKLVSAGCQPGKLRLIILTHGDFDHCGNTAYFRQKFDTKIAMHHDDSGMVEQGDMFWNRKTPNIIIRLIFGLLFRLNKANRFQPDFYLKDGDELSQYGFDAKVIDLPGHSQGSIGLLTSNGDLFCGDLLANVSQPELWSIMDQLDIAKNSVERLKSLAIDTIYPGHGQPFSMEQFIKNNN